MQRQIQVLPQQVAELIAAGEVVERPASVVKELVENAVDAGAQKITVEIKNGGTSYIRVTDDGGGIPKEQLATAFIRHATSKVSTAADLEAIGSFGFRGEALASIAAVSRVEVLSRTPDSVSGGRYVIHGSQQVELDDAGCPAGTTILVRDLFYNTPARMKFLKKDSTEAGSIGGILDKMALANPHIAFRFIRDGQVKLSTPGSGDLLSVIYAVYGREFSQTLLPVDYTHEFVTVRGYICRPTASRASRSMQTFFINSRYVRSRTCMAALEEAYKSSVMTGKFPACVLNVTVPFGAVDVNVHPAKIEVRFADERPVFDGVYQACRQALAAADEAAFLPAKEAQAPFGLSDMDYTGRQQRFSAEGYRQLAGQAGPIRPTGNSQTLSSPAFGRYESRRPVELPAISQRSAPAAGTRPLPPVDDLPFGRVPARLPTPEPQPGPPAPLPLEDSTGGGEARVIGELFATYILIEYNNTFVLVDKHAAHERILYNKLKDELELGERQVLLAPIPVTLSRQEYDAAVSAPELFLQVGIQLEDFGGGTVLVREVPTMLSQAQVPAAVQEIAGKLLEGKRQLLPETVDELIHSVACKAAIKGGDRTVQPEMELIVRMLQNDPSVRFCPHGRPVSITVTRAEIERKFGRLV